MRPATHRRGVAGLLGFKNTTGICGFGWLLAVLVIGFSGCATVDDPYHGLDDKSRYYRVRKGDTLHGIARRSRRDPGMIAKWNGISFPFRIHEDQILRLVPPAEPPAQPTPKEKAIEKPVRPVSKKTHAAVSGRSETGPGIAGSKRVSRQSDRSSARTKPTAKKRETAKIAPVAKKSASIKKSFKKNLKISWRWPLKGVIAKNYSQTGRKGLDIAGKFGEPVRAAADGTIVYCGQGLIGYGNLVIVKHDPHFLSAYGNNSRVLVQEGDIVKTGQRIAEVGIGKGKAALLHFEIRKDGKPVDPLKHLPKP